MHPFVQQYIVFHDQLQLSNSTPSEEWAKLITQIFQDHDARKEWIQWFEFHPHEEWISHSYVYFCTPLKKEDINAISTDDRYRIGAILARKNWHNRVHLHEWLNIPLLPSIRLELVNKDQKIHVPELQKLIPLPAIEQEETAFRELVSRISYETLDDYKMYCPEIFWYILNHQNIDIRAELAINLVDRLNRAPKLCFKLIPKEIRADGSYSCWKSIPQTIPKMIRQYVPELYEKYLFYKTQFEFSDAKALRLAHEHERNEKQMRSPLDLEDEGLRC